MINFETLTAFINILGLLISFGSFIVALLSFLNNEKKKRK